MSKVIYLQRIRDNGKSTIGELMLDNFKCYTIEDTGRDLNKDGDLDDPGEQKVYGQTRIPAGVYRIGLRQVGGMHAKYEKRFTFHRGMLEIKDVPGFMYILIHIGNTARDSAGCVLTGSKVLNDNFITGSTIAYTKLYKRCIEVLDRNELLFIDITDED